MHDIINYLCKQNIMVSSATVRPSFIDPLDELDLQSVDGLPYAKQAEQLLDLSGTIAESMSLASMLAVRYLCFSDGMSVLDVCAAPGLKGLYMNICEKLMNYVANDISTTRLQRLRRLFEKHSLSVEILKSDARFLHKVYKPNTLDRVLVDAPCSGEGVALAGNEKLAHAWSPAKVNRLQQLQIRIVKSAYTVLKPGGRMVYATCTLNLNENERVIRKALGIKLNVFQQPLQPDKPLKLSSGEAWRIEPSSNSIGFFIAVIDKPLDE